MPPVQPVDPRVLQLIQGRNLKPAPFQFAQMPPGLLGVSANPQIPPVGGYSDQNLTDMGMHLDRTGLDPAMLNRVQEVISNRRIAAQMPEELESQMLGPTTTQKAAALPSAAATKRRSLLDVLRQSRAEEEALMKEFRNQ
jgi:hypothetical protein